MNVCRSVAAYEISRINEICRMDGLIAEAEVRLCQAAGLHGVVGEVCLGIFICRQADNGNGVFVCADRAVAAEAPDLSGRLAFVGQFDRFVCQGRIRYVVYDADGEVVFRLSLFQVRVYSGDLSRRRILGSQAVAAADNDDIAAASLNQGALYV